MHLWFLAVGFVVLLVTGSGIADEPATGEGAAPTDGAATSDDSNSAEEIAEAIERLEEPGRGRFVYLRSGAPVVLQASPYYAAAISGAAERGGTAVTPPDGLELDPRSLRPDMTERGVTLFRLPELVEPRGLERSVRPNAWAQAYSSGLIAQPVFEQGAVLRIVSEEIIVAFPDGTTEADARRRLSGVWDKLRLTGLRELRPATFVVVLESPALARAFEVSRRLGEVEGVSWAQPSFINVYLETPGGPPAIPRIVSSRARFQQIDMLQALSAGDVILSHQREPEDEDWRLALDGHFESNGEDWYVARDLGSNRVLPLISRNHAHERRRAVFMSGKGLAGNLPPDPYAENVSSYIVSAVFEVTAQRDAFVEAWFRAVFEDPGPFPHRVRDFGRVLLYDVRSESFVYEYPIAPFGPSGDLTREAAAGGWRKLLFRIPQLARAGPMQLMVHFWSDIAGGAEGLYVDDIRVVGTFGDSSMRQGRDPAAARQYEILPRGQIAGLPGKSDPTSDAMAAWGIGSAERDVVVAVLDDGVERSHPDLAYWRPALEDERNEDGSEEADEKSRKRIRAWRTVFPGEPTAATDAHGTACAGVLGAVANDGVGIAGVAPGSLLLPLNRGIDDVSIVRAIDAAVELEADVLVIPWGWTGVAPEVFTETIRDALDAGMIVVAAAGDGVHRPYDHGVDYPCTLGESSSVICVGAASVSGEPKGWATSDGLYWWTSGADSSGPDVLAPGTWLHATDRRGPRGYSNGSMGGSSDWTDDFSGTGAAACYAAGVTALMISRDPEMPPDEVKRAMIGSATRLRHGTARRPEYRLVAPPMAVRQAVESARKREEERRERRGHSSPMIRR